MNATILETDIAETSAVLVYNIGEEMQKKYGVMNASGKIAEFAINFCKEHKEPFNWDSFTLKKGYSDWEEYLVSTAIKKLLR